MGTLDAVRSCRGADRCLKWALPVLNGSKLREAML